MTEAATTIPGSTLSIAFELPAIPNVLLNVTENSAPSSAERTGAVTMEVEEPASARPLRYQLIVNGVEPTAWALKVAISPLRTVVLTGSTVRIGGPSPARAATCAMTTTASQATLRRHRGSWVNRARVVRVVLL